MMMVASSPSMAKALISAAVLTACLVCVASAAAEKWSAIVGPVGEISELASSTGSLDFHGVYGSPHNDVQFALVHNNDDTVAVQTITSNPAVFNFNVDRGTRLWVVEGKSTAETGLFKAFIENATKWLKYSDVTVLAEVTQASSLVVAGDLWNIDLPGKATRISVPALPVVSEPPQRPPNLKLPAAPDPIIADALTKVTAASLISSVKSLSQFFTRQSNSYQAVDAEIWLTEQYIRYGFDVSTMAFRTNYSSNVIATLKGTKYPDQYVIAGAHYDSRSTSSQDPTLRAPGADDNGSGTAALLELAKLIFQNKLQFDYTLVLASFGGEEQGLLGSRAYAARLKEQDQKVVAMFNSDMLGYLPPGSVPTAGMKDRYVSEWLLEAADAYTALYVPRLLVKRSASCCSDHQSFFENGFPAIGFFENPGSASDYPHYHKSTDLPEYIDEDNIELLTKAMIASAMSFAVPDDDSLIIKD